MRERIKIRYLRMRIASLSLALLFLVSSVSSQSPLEGIFEAQSALGRAVAERGIKPGFMEFLADDAVLFRPEPISAREYLNGHRERRSGSLRRTVSFADIAANGILGYTTGQWTITQATPAGPEERVGQYATVWQKKQDGSYKAILDIEIAHEPYNKVTKPPKLPTARLRDTNNRRWSAADSTMNFLRIGMTEAGLGEAYDRFAANDVRLLRDGLPPIEGRRDAKSILKRYTAVEFPGRVSQFETSDMAYTWNPCSYSDSNEGMERGNCLHVWKLRNKKWYIVLGVFARIPNETIPVLKESPRSRN